MTSGRTGTTELGHIDSVLVAIHVHVERLAGRDLCGGKGREQRGGTVQNGGADKMV